MGTGDLDAIGAARTTRELASVTAAVEAMRRRLALRADDLAEHSREEALVEERERVADDVRERTIQRVFALGLSISALSAEGRAPSSGELRLHVLETDLIIRELREVIFPDDRADRDPASHPTRPRQPA